ncbi:hypothetical protein SISSUDRAFT_224908 [Sistotremastrum suecicum HHB10207 ss-3]|uniref:Uncharacterized protein n=1 Tax=Sistotremastrum suecicum HHB10207 ss-3 TaxID=1314776 RepID=A0A166A3L2_9AGAM|nr:hypothetical protein SISSUDRAFT_224908 [Sistotremastrum suecicum HHB10207 ss-3]
MPSRHWASRLGDDSETLVGSSSRLRSPRMRQRSPYSHGADLPSGSLRALLTTDRLPESFSTPGMSGRSGAVAGPSNATPSMPSSASLPTNAQAAINEGMAGVRALLREDSSDSSMDSAQNPFINRPQNITNPIADQSNSSASASPSSEEDSSAEYVLVGRDIAREQAPAQPQRAASPEASLPPRAIQRILRPVERYPGRVPTVPGYGSFSEGSSDDEPWGRGADLLREQLHGRVRDHLPDESANAMQVDDESANVGSLDRDANPTTLFPPSDSLPSTSESARRRSRTEGAFPLDLDLTGFDPSFERDIEQVLRPPSRPRSPLIHPSSSSNTRVGSRPHIFHSSSSSTSNVTREQGRRGVFEFLRDAPTSLFSLPPVEPSHVDSDREGMSEEGTQAQGALNMFDRPLLRRRSSLGGLSPGPSGLSSSPETSSRIPRSYSPDQDSITLAQRRLQSAREARESREASRRPGSSSRQVLDVLPRTTAQRRIEERRLALEFDRSERLRASESRERSERRVGGTRDQDRVWPNPTHGRPELLSPVHHQRSASTAAALREPVYGDIPTAAHENNRRRARMRMREALAERMRRAVDEDRSGRSPATWNRSREENLPIFGSGSVASASSSSSSNAPSLPPLEFGPGRSRDPSPMRVCHSLR